MTLYNVYLLTYLLSNIYLAYILPYPYVRAHECAQKPTKLVR